MPHYWASYGRCGFLGRFEAISDHRRGDLVAVNSPRGKETATILGPVDERVSDIAVCGEILGVASDATIDTSTFLVEATDSASSLPVLVADFEWLDDGHTAIVHVMPYDDVDLTAWAVGLSKKWNVDVRLLNLAALPVERLDPTKCDKPDCGNGDCGSGCSTGSCSKGSVKSPEELTKYFASLREAMESKRTSLV